MGFCQLSLFGGYAIYLPELFPRGCVVRARPSAITSDDLLLRLDPWRLGC